MVNPRTPELIPQLTMKLLIPPEVQASARRDLNRAAEGRPNAQSITATIDHMSRATAMSHMNENTAANLCNILNETSRLNQGLMCSTK